jgi:CRP-like cAMP-binding protein
MNIASLAGHLAFGLIAFSFLVKDIFWLRIVSILASLFSVFYNYLIPLEPMWLAINWNFIFIAVNLYHIAVILYEKREVKMDAKNQELYDTLFSEMTPVEYLKISRAAKWELVKSGQRIITQGMPVPDLYLIYNGTVDVIVDNEQIAELKDGEFVGEMSFLTEKVATATCKVKYDAQCLVWKQKEFKELLKRNPSLYFTIQSVLSSQVSDKLVKSSK